MAKTKFNPIIVVLIILVFVFMTKQKGFAGDLITQTFVKFRTLNPIIDSTLENAIAWTTSCGSELTSAGQGVGFGFGSSGKLCGEFMPTQGYTKIMDLPTGVTAVKLTYSGTVYTATSNFGLWFNGAVDYAVCGDNPRPVYLTFRTSSIVGVSSLSTSPLSIDISKEVLCTATCIPGDGLDGSACDGQVSRAELGIAVNQWVVGTMPRADLGAAIMSWVNG